MAVLAIVVPVRNEEDNVERLVGQLLDVFSETDHHVRIFFVDDSVEGNPTPDVVASLVAKYPGTVRLERRPPQSQFGVTSAVLNGYMLAKTAWDDLDYIVVMDGDLQHPPEVIPQLVAKATGGYDMVVASRYTGEGSATGLGSLFRHLASKGLRLLPWIFLPPTRQVTDPLSGCYLVRASLINLQLYRAIGWKVILEVLVMSPGLKTIAEVPYEFQARGGGASKANFKPGLELFWQVISLAFRRYGRYLNRF